MDIFLDRNKHRKVLPVLLNLPSLSRNIPVTFDPLHTQEICMTGCLALLRVNPDIHKHAHKFNIISSTQAVSSFLSFSAVDSLPAALRVLNYNNMLPHSKHYLLHWTLSRTVQMSESTQQDLSGS